MALSVTEANTVSSKWYDKTLVQQVYEDSAFYTKLKQMNQVVPGGSSITFPIRYVKLSDADAVGARQQITYKSKETRTQAVLDWKYYIGQGLISWDERVKNSESKAQVVNLMKDKAAELKEDMTDRFQTDLFTENPNGNGFSSLATIVDSTTTYAGIAYTDAAAWASIEDSSTTTLNLYTGDSTGLAGAVNAATFGKSYPTMHITTRNLQSTFESLIEPQKRYSDEKMANAGFPNVAFHGAGVFGDDFCTDNTWYGLCMKHLYIVVHPDFNMKLSSWEELGQAGYPHALKRTLSWAGNIKSTMRKCHFKFTALDPTN